MDPQNPTPAETTPATATPAPGAPAPAAVPASTPAPAKFSPEQQEEVNRIVQQRLADDRQRRAAPAAPAAPPSGDGGGKPKPEQPLTEEAVLDLFARQRAFSTALTGYQIEPPKLARMEAAFRAERPADAATWAQSYIADMGFPKAMQQPTTPAPAATPASPEPLKPPAAAPAAPSPHTVPTANGLPDIFNMNPPQFGQFVQTGQLRSTLEKMWAIGATQQGAPRRPTLPQNK
jgi:hypothetical protein